MLAVAVPRPTMDATDTTAAASNLNLGYAPAAVIVNMLLRSDRRPDPAAAPCRG